MLLFVWEVFWVDSNDLSTLVAVVGEHILVTLQKVEKKSVAFADISIEPVILFSSPWCSRDGHRGGRTWKEIDENKEEKKWHIWYTRVTKIRAHLCPARLSSQWWQNMASVSWTSSAGDLQVSQDQWQSVCWQELVQSFLSLDFHFYCKINWNTASYFRKVSGRSASCFGQIDSFTFTTDFVFTSWPIQLLILVRIYSWEWSVRRFPDTLRWHLEAKDPFGLAD